MSKLVVDAASEGARLDVWLARASGTVRSEVQRLIAAGLVRVDGGPATKSMRVIPGQAVHIEQPPPEEAAEPAPEVEVRYEDEHLAVVNKPAGLVVHSFSSRPVPTLVDSLSRRMPLAPAAGAARPGIVHRLDKGTSGLMVVAKTDRAYHALVDAMKGRRIDKTYLALVEGSFSVPRGRIEAPIARSAKNPMAMAIAAGGRPSVTEFEVLETVEEASYLRVELKTGRTHQIRVHLAHIGRPVVGDKRYGGGAEHLARELGLERPFLHAHRLRFNHPLTGDNIDVEEPLPEDLARALEIARRRARTR